MSSACATPTTSWPESCSASWRRPAERGRRSYKTLADLNERIEGQEQAVVNLQTLYEYCVRVEEELAGFDFGEKRGSG